MTQGAEIQISDEIEFPALTSPLLPSETADPLLADLVRLADTLDVEHAISLTLGGSLITGSLFSGYRFYEAQAAAASGGAILGASDVEAARSYKQHMVEFYTARMRLYEPARLIAEGSRYAPRYIHMHNAKWVGNDGMFTGESKLWRGRLIVVGGFSVTQI